MRTLYLIIFTVFILSCNTSTSNKPVASKPNVIIILADDLGYKDVGFNGATDIKTPNIDRIAQNGVLFTNAYVSYPVCGPSRAGLITGRYQDRFGFSRNPLFAPKDINQGLPLDQTTMAESLSDAGYRNMAIGKWHLGAHKDLRPLKRGFHEFFGFLSGGHAYYPSKWTLNDISEVKTQYGAYRTKLLRDNVRIEEEEYLTDALSREAVDFVKRNNENPFFLYLAYNAPHGPMQATQRHLDRYKHIKNRKRQVYAAMVSAMDDGVGMLINELDSLNILDNTIIFFLSDNGGKEQLGADNGELKKGKGSLYEGGIHVPFAMQWPLKIKSGSTYHLPIVSLDIFGTLKDELNLKTSSELDGVNLLPYINGEMGTKSPHNALFWRKADANSMAVRKVDEKWVKEPVSEYYNLDNDISEENPLSISQADSIKWNQLYQTWNEQNSMPKFLGLHQDSLYSSQHPDRFKGIDKY